jgi:hypothetical protein
MCKGWRRRDSAWSEMSFRIHVIIAINIDLRKMLKWNEHRAGLLATH